MIRIRTIDAQVAGAPLRLITEGFPTLHGATMAAKLEGARHQHDALRRALMLDPRGHADMSGALLTGPVQAGADAGVVFMHASDFGALCGHGVIATVTIALQYGLIAPPPDRRAIVLETAAGPVTAAFTRDPDGRVTSVTYGNPPAFVLVAGGRVRLREREVLADIACCGELYAIVDAEAAGVALDRTRVGELRRIGLAIAEDAHAVVRASHPDPAVAGFAGTIFIGSGDRGDLRSATIYTDGALDRSPGGTATGAVMAVLDAMGLLPEDRAFTHESLIGTTLRGRIRGRIVTGGRPAIVPEIEGTAFITGEHTFLLDERDPLNEGYRL